LRTKEISSLCIDIENNQFKCVYFSNDKLPHQMIEYFIVFGSDYQNQLFDLIWKEKESQFCIAVNASDITFNDIHQKVWKPTIKSCKDLLHKLSNKSFTYSDIKDFTCIRNINIHINALYNAMHKCYSSYVSSLPEPKYWVQQAVKYIALYLDFANNTGQVNAAKLCLDLKAILKLKGDFSVVHNLESEVSSCCKIIKF